MADTPWSGSSDDKLYLTSGQFTSTLKDSESISAVELAVTGISYDGTNTPWIGSQADKLYLQSGQFTSTLKTSEDVSTVDTTCNDISYDGTNTPWIGSQADKLYLQSGQFTSTLKTSEDVSTVDTSLTGISYDGTNTPWSGSEAGKLYLQSGQFTSTLKTSEDVSTVDASVSGICTNAVNARLGITNDADITLPQFTVQGLGGATGELTFPAVSVEGYGASSTTGYIPLPQLSIQGISAIPATATLTLPILTVNAIGHGEAIATLTLSQFTVIGTRGYHGIIQIILPNITSDFSGFSGSSDGTTIALPAFTISIRTGLTNSTLLPQLSLAATGHSGFVGTYAKSLPRMIVNVKGTVHRNATFNVSLPAFTLGNTVLTGNISLASTRNLPVFNINAHGFRGENGDGALTFPAFTLATESYQSLSGTVVQSLKMLTLDAYADSYTNRII